VGDETKMAVIQHLRFSNLKKNYYSTIVNLGFCIFIQNFMKFGLSADILWPKQCFPIGAPF